MPSSLSDKVSNPDAKTIRAEAEKCGIDFKNRRRNFHFSVIPFRGFVSESRNAVFVILIPASPKNGAILKPITYYVNRC